MSHTVTDAQQATMDEINRIHWPEAEWHPLDSDQTMRAIVQSYADPDTWLVLIVHPSGRLGHLSASIIR